MTQCQGGFNTQHIRGLCNISYRLLHTQEHNHVLVEHENTRTTTSAQWLAGKQTVGPPRDLLAVTIPNINLNGRLRQTTDTESSGDMETHCIKTRTCRKLLCFLTQVEN